MFCFVASGCFAVSCYGGYFAITMVDVLLSLVINGGDDAVYVFDINQPRLHNPFYFVLVSVSVLWPFQPYFIP